MRKQKQPIDEGHQARSCLTVGEAGNDLAAFRIADKAGKVRGGTLGNTA